MRRNLILIENLLQSNPDETLLPTKKDKKKEKAPRSKTLTEGVKFDLDKFSFNLSEYGNVSTKHYNCLADLIMS